MSLVARFPRHRILVSRFFGLALVALLIFTDQPLFSPATAQTVRWVGFVLLLVAAFGRLWSLQYLAGFKSRKVVSDGPYSIVRNPLYLFSFAGAAGLALSANHAGFLAALLLAYLLYYPFVVISEERGLRQILGQEYLEYCQRVPRFIPRFSGFSEPENYEIRAARFSRNYLEVVWFPLSWMVLQWLETARTAGQLPLRF
ncbi:MAG: isoprenylcysteine carboxylmethyltransferase family protein [Calditrichaeota bacterium]|nr:isoprenylcysteine carboxylmethyltransferase family protein [Candidatus Cloacimonadota bacterium]MCB1047803.1 isoprenylcysteine carboxylmethyltransferase family protein [Calditrichota bacterium]MCB9474009.1 isoprenylcysteine carboxylmethyltransferase family protein [Candidatus Delongbacteria bacterium]